MRYSILTAPPGADYELLDSGNGEKLERYGDVVVARPDPQALWRQHLSEKDWQKANAYFKRSEADASWSTRGSVPERWAIELGGLKFWIKLSAFKHTGLFPEQAPNWEWISSVILNTFASFSINSAKRSEESLSKRKTDRDPSAEPQDDKRVRVLNLFGYTGGATLAAARAGAEVVHVDGSKTAIGWARANAELSGFGDKPIRWILDDAAKFVQREIKRGRKYDGIIMDPPAFGHGPNKELWKIENNFLPLIEACQKILSDKPLFFLLNGYAAGYSAFAYKNSLQPIVQAYGGKMEIGELTIAEAMSGRLLSCGIFARWSCFL